MLGVFLHAESLTQAEVVVLALCLRAVAGHRTLRDVLVLSVRTAPTLHQGAARDELGGPEPAW